MSRRKFETFISPLAARSLPADHPLRQVAPIASAEKMAQADVFICRRASDPPPADAQHFTEYPGTCRDCGEGLIRRNPLPNRTAQLICLQCWHGAQIRHARATPR